MIRLLLAALLMFPAVAAQAQTTAARIIEIPAPDVTQELELNDGSSVIGRVESVGEGRFVFRTTSGVEMTVDVVTVRSLKQGEAYFGVYEVLLPFVQVGITDRISIGAGTPLVFGDFERPFWITPKVQLLERGSTAVAAGVMHFFNIDDANVGIAYGVVTQGSADSALTIGVGYAYERTDEDDAGSGVLMIGGEHRVSRRVKFVTENYVFKGGGFVSGGVRFFGEKLSADFGLVMPLFEDTETVPFPMINIVRKF